MKKNLIYALLCAMVSLSGCEKLKDATSRDFNVKNISFDFSATVRDEVTPQSGDLTVTTRAGEMRSFSETRTVDVSEIGSSDVVDFAKMINKAEVNAASVSITTVPSGSYTVTDLTISAPGVPGSLVVPAYVIGEAFTAPANMGNYMSAFIMRIVNANSITVTVSGQIDAPSGTTILISYKSDVVFTASLL